MQEGISEPSQGFASQGRLNAFADIVRGRPDAATRAVIVAVAFILAWYTWAHWGDIQVDCGRELYVPVQILRGKLLYRDLWYPYGPLAPYVEALLVGVFGQHLNAFYLFGIAITIACALSLFEIGAMLEGRAVGLTAALVMLLQGFAPTSFNYVFPYAYAALLGLLLSLLCALLTLRYVLRPAERTLLLAGLAAGTALLCKQEVGAACYVMLAFVIVAEAAQERSSRVLLRSIATCAPGVVLWAVVYGWLFVTLTPRLMLDNWIGAGGYFVRTYGAHLYADIGMRFVPSELGLLALGSASALLLWYLIARISRSCVGRVWPMAGVVAALAAGLLAARYWGDNFPATWLAANMVLYLFLFPVGMFFIGCGFLVYALYGLYQNPGERHFLAEAALGVLALASAVRVIGLVVPYGYSIFYDVPLLLVFIIAIAKCVGAAVPAPDFGRRRMLINSLLTAEVVMLAILVIPGTSRRTTRLETSWGAIYLEPDDADAARQILDFISEQKRQGRRITVLPEAPMMYALTGTEAPDRWYTVLPGFPSPTQEEDYIADLRSTDPDYIVLTNRNYAEYGAPYFGIDFDQKVYRWIEANYRPVGQFGNFRRDGSRLLAAMLYQRLDRSERAGVKPLYSSSDHR